MSKYVLLVKQSEEHVGTDTWWKRGEYEAESPVGALHVCYDNVFRTPSRGGNVNSCERVAVVGPDCGWVEFDVRLRAMPAEVTSIEQVPRGTRIRWP